MKRFQCPFGQSILRASNQKELDKKITTHNAVAHGPYPMVVCGGLAPGRVQGAGA